MLADTRVLANLVQQAVNGHVEAVFAHVRAAGDLNADRFDPIGANLGELARLLDETRDVRNGQFMLRRGGAERGLQITAGGPRGGNSSVQRVDQRERFALRGEPGARRVD